MRHPDSAIGSHRHHSQFGCHHWPHHQTYCTCFCLSSSYRTRCDGSPRQSRASIPGHLFVSRQVLPLPAAASIRSFSFAIYGFAPFVYSLSPLIPPCSDLEGLPLIVHSQQGRDCRASRVSSTRSRRSSQWGRLSLWCSSSDRQRVLLCSPDCTY